MGLKLVFLYALNGAINAAMKGIALLGFLLIMLCRFCLDSCLLPVVPCGMLPVEGSKALQKRISEGL